MKTPLSPFSLVTFSHEERFAGENPAGHSDASRSELRIFQAVVPTQLGQQFRGLQAVPPGVVTFTKEPQER